MKPLQSVQFELFMFSDGSPAGVDALEPMIDAARTQCWTKLIDCLRTQQNPCGRWLLKLEKEFPQRDFKRMEDHDGSLRHRRLR